MFMRTFFRLALLAAAVGIPYAWYQHGSVVESAKGLWTSVTARASDEGETDVAGLLESPDAGEASPQAPFDPSAQAGSGGVAFHQPSTTGGPVTDLGEVLRFDVTPQWVKSRWSRVSTTLAEIDLEGMRVPLVTGAQVDDLAGSLTYYFDEKQVVQRITFDGFTGSERRLVDLVTKYYQFEREPALGAGLYLVKWNGKPASALRVRHAAVVRTDSPHSQLQVQLEINRPGRRYGLSPGMQQIIDHDRDANRWGSPSKGSMKDRILSVFSRKPAATDSSASP